MSDKKKLVSQLRKLLKSRNDDLSLEEGKVNSDKFLERFLSHNGWCIEKTLKVLENYVRDNRELELECPARFKDFPEEARTFYKTKFGGNDYQNRPVGMVTEILGMDIRHLLDGPTGPAVDKAIFQYSRKHQVILEKLVLENNVDNGVYIINMANLKLHHCLHRKSFELIIQHAKKLELCSPGLIGKVILVNAPPILKVMVKMVYKLVKFSSEVVIFSSSELDWKIKLRDHVPENNLCPEFGGSLTTFLDV